ncbi:hypothetical protein [Paenarthrobacter sp. 22069]|uniref:hypothetical protein n=1 Tax=Paenarthrobacter sp. 22069 TaxID=3453864 RepID=UPI003F827BBE
MAQFSTVTDKAMEPNEYTETFERLSIIVGRTIARQIVDEMDDERTAAKAQEERIRSIVRHELGL